MPETPGVLYDFGLGRRAGHFGVRTSDAALQARLDSAIGLQWRDALASIGSDLVEASPTRVVRHPLGRIEVAVPIPPPGDRSPAGPHTHLLPTFLAQGADAPANLPVPEAYIPCAIHYPDPTIAAGDTAPPGGHEPMAAPDPIG